MTQAAIQLAGSGDPARAPETVEFRFGAEREPATLAELEPAFGAWTDDVPGISAGDPYQLDFTTFYPPELRAARPRGPLTAVRVSLSGDPRSSGVRVRRVLLRRFAAEP